jgi:hypothetical protein
MSTGAADHPIRDEGRPITADPRPIPKGTLMPTATADTTHLIDPVSQLVIVDVLAVIDWLEHADPDTRAAYIWADPGPTI